MDSRGSSGANAIYLDRLSCLIGYGIMSYEETKNIDF